MTEETAAGALVAIVEDDAAIAEGLALNLKLLGYRTETIGDGETAVTRIEEVRPDLVLLDITLPIQSGLWVLGQLRGRQNQVPIIVLSARQDEFDKVAALGLGADDYITKPFALAELLARVAAVLRRARLSDPSRAPYKHAATPERGSTARQVLRFGDVAVGPGRTDRESGRLPGEAHAPRVRAAQLPLQQQRPRPPARGAPRDRWGPSAGPGSDRRQLRRAASRQAASAIRISHATSS